MPSQCARVDGAAVVPLTGVRFGLLGTEDIVKLSVQEMNKPADVVDSVLGLPLADNASCTYCGTEMTNMHQCPGHFGRVNLATPVYHPAHIRTACEVLKQVCLGCGSLRKKKKKGAEVSVDGNDPPPPPLELALPVAPTATPVPVRKKKKPKADPDQNYIVISDDECDLFIDMEVEDSKVYGQAFSAASPGICRFCLGQYKHPLVKVALLKVTEPRGCVQAIRLRFPGNDEPPEGYWHSLRIGIERQSYEEKFDLLPSQARTIFRRIRATTLQELGLDARSEAFVIDAFPIPPNCMQASGNAEYDIDCSATEKTQALKNLVRKNTVLKFAKRKSSKSVDVESKALQLQISQYLRLKGCAKIPGNFEPTARKRKTPVKYGAIWKQRLKDTILGKMTQYCALALLTGDPNIGIEEIMLPDEIASQVTVPERVTIHNCAQLQVLVSKMESGFIERNGTTEDLRRLVSRRLDVGDILHRPIQTGDVLYANRTPSLHKHSIISFKARVYAGKTIRVNPLVCAPFQADFDGDRMHVFFPQAPDVITESSELMGLKSQFVSSQNGDVLTSLTQDCLLAAYRLVSGKMLYTASEMNQLVVHTDKTLPVPGVLKSTKGPLWTGFQVFSLLLPPKLTFCTNDGGVLIQDGELLKIGDSWSWLKGTPEGLLHAIYQQLGVDAAVGYLDSCSVMLQELLLIEGFSIGLEDFSIGTKASFREAVSGIIEKAEGSLTSFEDAQLEVEQVVRRHTTEGNALHSMMMAGSKGSTSFLRKHVGCLGVQLHRNEEPVPGYSAFIGQSFWNGLDSSAFLHHSICTRDMLTKQLHLSSAGVLGDTLMKLLADVYYAYDGTVRHRSTQQVLRFEFGEDGKTDPGEPVGILAATAIKKQAYEAVLSAPHNPSKYLEMFKQTLQSSSKKPTTLKDQDQTVMLRLKPCMAEDCRCLERRMLQLEAHLQKLTLEEVTRRIVIEWSGDGWLCHFHLSEGALDRRNLFPRSILFVLRNYIREKHPDITLEYNAVSCEGRPCIHLEAGTADEYIANSLKRLKEVTVPELLKVSVTASSLTKSVSIVWEDNANLFGLDQERGDGELALKAVMIGESPFDMIKTACGDLVDVVDWERSTPCSIQQVFESLGIEAAYQCIYQRLLRIMKTLAVRVDPAHIALVAEFCTHTGSVLGYTEAGFTEFLKCVGASAPFLQATLKVPIKKFVKAAECGLDDSLDNVASSISWGRRPLMGTGSDFKLLWSEKKVEDQTFDLWTKIDVHEYLACVAEDGIQNSPDTPSIAEDRETDACMSPFIDRSYAAPFETPWNADENATGNLDGGWTGGQNDSGNVDAGWGSADDQNKSGNSGWGSEDQTGSGMADGVGWGATEDQNASGNAGWGSEDQTGSGMADGVGWGAAEDQTAAGNADGGSENRSADFQNGSGPDDGGFGSVDDQSGIEGGWGASSNTAELSQEWGSNYTAIAMDTQASAVAANEAAHRERLKHFASEEDQVPSAKDDQDDGGSKKPFVPSGSNLIPLGRRRAFRSKFQAPTVEEDVAPSTPLADKWTSTPGSIEKVNDWIAGSATVEDGDGDGDAGWDSTPMVVDGNKDDGWGTPAPMADTNDDDDNKDDGWGTSVPTADTNEDDGWGQKSTEAVDNNAWNATEPEENAAAAIEDGQPPVQRGSYKRPARSGMQTAPRRPMDPTRQRFNDEVCALVRSVRDILTRYEPGDRLSEEDEMVILEKVLVHHPGYTLKVGDGIDHIKVDRPANYAVSSCFFVVRKDGSMDDFSYHKCLKKMAEQTFPVEYQRLYDYLFLHKDREI